MRVRPAVFICAIVALLLPRDTGAQSIPGWMQKSFTGERIDADRVRLMREVEIEGEPGTAQAGQKFFADDLQMNIKTGELIAEGNVVYQTPTARIAADSVVFNTKTSLGTFNNANGIAQLGERGERNLSMFGGLEPDVFFYGARIEKIGSDKYRITKGGFTTCVQPSKRWEIVSGTATLRLDHYVMMRNAVVEVKDVPVFYLPVLYYPIQEDDRATGFLLPMYGSSLAIGSSISNAFFWAINRSHDATLFHDYMFSRGNGLGAEYRYMIAPQAQGDFRYYWLDENEAIINGGTRPARQSKSIRGNLSQNLPYGLAARGRIDYITDVTVRQTYDHNFYNASNSSRSYEGGVSGAWRNLSTNARFGRNEIFSDAENSTVTGQAPGFTAALSGVRLGPLPVFGTVNADGGQNTLIYRRQGVETDLGLFKADFSPSIRAPLSTLPFLQVNATASYRTTYYSESLAGDRATQIAVPVTRNYGDMRVDVIGPVVSRVFNPNNAMADRMKHVVEPSFSVQRRTEIANQDRIPTSTGYDIIIGGVTQMSYGLTNRILVRKDKAGEAQASAPRELVNVSVRQSYYTDENAAKFDTSYSYGYSSRAASAFSPIAMVARATPVNPLAIDYRLEYDPKAVPGNPKLLGMGLNGTLRTPAINATGGWSRTPFTTTSATGAVTQANNLINTAADFRILQSRIGGSVSFNYDVARSLLYSQRYVGFYNAQCCGIQFEYQAVNYPNSNQFYLPHDRRFNMSFTLAGVGSFSNFFGAFGGSTY
ncbi:MAG TPA: putative LPS assembly protein LptD [Vicinamibacterales bacterium]|nr:putative LPS assembly protein LptD [Vicinamibacterales bacterium]